MAFRWEWRTFGDDFGPAERRLETVEIERVQESDETYLLSPQGVDAVKLRDGLMDIKHLEQIDADGLELWKPVMKAPMPLSAQDERTVLAALGVDALDGPDVSAVDVHKTRRHFTLGGCMGELTDVRTANRSTRTLAIEAEDPARVIAAVRELGLEARPNTNFPSGLKALT